MKKIKISYNQPPFLVFKFGFAFTSIGLIGMFTQYPNWPVFYCQPLMAVRDDIQCKTAA